VLHFSAVAYLDRRSPVKYLFLALVLCLLHACRNDKAINDPANHFVGKWKLNADKSPQPKVGSFYLGSYWHAPNLLTIEHQGRDFKFILGCEDCKDDEGQWFITDMKGHAAAVHIPKAKLPANSRIFDPEVYATRINSYAFVESTSISHSEFQVSADGNTMTVHRDIFADNEFERVFVYDRIR
jgi:hypothetical protein